MLYLLDGPGFSRRPAADSIFEPNLFQLLPAHGEYFDVVDAGQEDDVGG